MTAAVILTSQCNTFHPHRSSSLNKLRWSICWASRFLRNFISLLQIKPKTNGSTSSLRSFLAAVARIHPRGHESKVYLSQHWRLQLTAAVASHRLLKLNLRIREEEIGLWSYFRERAAAHPASVNQKRQTDCDWNEIRLWEELQPHLCLMFIWGDVGSAEPLQYQNNKWIKASFTSWLCKSTALIDLPLCCW